MTKHFSKLGKAGIMSFILWTAFNATSLFAQTLPASGNLSGSYTAIGGTTYTGSYTLTGATTITVTSGTATISGVIEGSSSLTKAGTGTLTLSGANTYTGYTAINDGTLSLSGTASSIANSASVTLNGSGGLNISNGTNNKTIKNLSSTSSSSSITLGIRRLTIDQNASYQFAGIISGTTGGITKEGVQVLSLTGDNSYTGETIINAGTLAIADGSGTSGDIKGNVTVKAGATLRFNRSGAYTYSKTISGEGNVSHLTSLPGDVLTLSGSSSSYSGTITTDGTLIPSGSIGNASVTLNSTHSYPATLDISAGSKIIRNLNSIYPNSSVKLGSSTLTVSTDENCSFAGIISGTGGIAKDGKGTLTLTGANTYGGMTRIYNDGTLTLSGSGTVIASSSEVQLINSSTLNITSPQTIRNLNSSVNTTQVTLNNYVLTIDNSDAGTFAGVISSSAGTSNGLIKTGSGTLTLSSANTYTGPTTINTGVLILNTNGTIANSSGVTINSDARLSIITAKTIKALNSASSDARVTLNSYVLTIDNSASCTFAGVISSTGTSNGLTKTGSGSLYLTGDNTYTGSTIISGGILSVGNATTAGDIAGNITNNATLYFNRSNAYTYNRVISGTGDVYQRNPTATLTFGGDNTYTGITYLNGPLTLSASGTIAGSSSVTMQSNDALLTISSDNKTIKALNGASSNSGVALGSRTLTVDNSADCSFDGKISGTGGITKTGAAKLTLSGINAYTGETTIDEGTLALTGNIETSSGVTLNGAGKLDISAGYKTIQGLNSAGALSEVILFSGSLLNIGTTDDSNGGGSFAGVFSGASGGVRKRGTATFTIANSANSATGSFYCDQGTVVLAGNWAYAFLKEEAATLTVEGNCSIGGYMDMNGGVTNMNLNDAEPSFLSVTGNLSVTGTNTINITDVGSASSYPLITATSGIDKSNFTLTGEPGTLEDNGLGTELMFTTAVEVVTIPPSKLGNYIGTVTATNTTLGLDETVSGITVELQESASGIYSLVIEEIDLGNGIVVPSYEVDNITAAFESGDYILTREGTITGIVIPEVTVPPIPLVLPAGGTFYDVPVTVKLLSAEIVDNILTVHLEVTATILIGGFVPVPVSIDVIFEGVYDDTTTKTFVPIAPQRQITGYRSITGQRLAKEPQSGVYIILYDDGKAEKVVK